MVFLSLFIPCAIVSSVHGMLIHSPCISLCLTPARVANHCTIPSGLSLPCSTPARTDSVSRSHDAPTTWTAEPRTPASAVRTDCLSARTRAAAPSSAVGTLSAPQSRTGPCAPAQTGSTATPTTRRLAVPRSSVG